MADEEARPDVVLTLVDSEGREWLAAAYVGDLERYDGKYVVERRSIHESEVAGFKLRGFTVVQR